MAVDEVKVRDWMNRKGIRRADPNDLADPKVREKYRADTSKCPQVAEGLCMCVDELKPDYRFPCSGLWFKTCSVYLKVKSVV